VAGPAFVLFTGTPNVLPISHGQVTSLYFLILLFSCILNSLLAVSVASGRTDRLWRAGARLFGRHRTNGRQSIHGYRFVINLYEYYSISACFEKVQEKQQFTSFSYALIFDVCI
jgi:hypothetical protein